MDLSELTSFVEAHPDDHEQRWRLAKKLYMDCEYRQALDHLLILRTGWQPRVNLSRYLAATYYRLGRYDDALREISTALQRWPEEISLHEQVARVYEVTERIPQALESWREIQRLKSDHPMAARSITRLEALLSDDAPDEIPIGDSDSGIDISGVVCAVCGAQNSSEFSRCWQCHALLDEHAAVATPAPDVHATPRPHAAPQSQRFVVAMWLIAAGALALDVFLTLSHLEQLSESAGDAPFLTLRSLLEHEFAFTRITLGIGIAVLWPVSIWVAMRMVDIRAASGMATSAVTGLLAASVTYLATWAPGLWFAAAPLIGALVTLIILWYCVPIGLGRLLGAWGIQGGLVAAAALTGVLSMHGIGPLRDAGALVRFAKSASTGDNPGVHRAPDVVVNRELRVYWESSGSRWLDSLPLAVRFAFTDVPVNKPLYVEFLEGERILAGRNLDNARVTFTESPIYPEVNYHFTLSGPEDTPPITLRVYSLLRPIFNP